MKKTERWQRLLAAYEAALAAEVEMYLENISGVDDERERESEKGLWLTFIAGYSTEIKKILDSYNTAGSKDPYFHGALSQSIRDGLQRSVLGSTRVITLDEINETIMAFHDIFSIKSMSKVILSMEELSQLVD